MLPLTLLTSASSAPVSVEPPPRFRAPLGKIRNVRIRWTDEDRLTPADDERLTPAQQQGLRYEEQAQKHLSKLGWQYARSPRIFYVDDRGPSYIVPDGLIVHDGIVWDHRFMVIVEVKIQHMPEAWWQLERLYRPILQAAAPKADIYCLEVCRSYDPSMPFPCLIEMVQDLKKWLSSPGQAFAVYQWKQ